MDSLEVLSARAVAAMQEAIAAASGREVFFVGRLGEDGRIASVQVGARGNRSAVPALGPLLDDADAVLHNHPNGELSPSTPDLSVAARLGEAGTGFIIVNNSVSQAYVVFPPVARVEREPIDAPALVAALDRGPGLESRPAQQQMVSLVADAFNSDRIQVIEAGTGVGKSLGYLLPAMEWVHRNEERVVLSTATINLQQQLLDHDIPRARRILGTDTSACLVKGRSNYLCLSRLREAVSEIGLFDADDPELQALADWSRESPTGSRSDLPVPPRPQLWSRVCSEPDACSGLRCPDREGCFILRARRQAAASQVLVVNHHLLFSDLSVRLAGVGFESAAVLPRFHRIVFDEAHNIERSATSFFSATIHRGMLRGLARRFLRRHRGRQFGLLPSLRLLAGVPNQAGQRHAQMVQAIEQTADALEAAAAAQLEGEGSRGLGLGVPPRALAAALENTEDTLRELVAAVQGLVDKAPAEETVNPTAMEALIQARRLARAADLCLRLRAGDPPPGDVRWLERGNDGSGQSTTRLVISPLDVAPVLREAVYEPYATVVMTSATLAIGDRFDFWCSRVGLTGHDRPAATAQLPSPFDYRAQVFLGVPHDIPEPGEPGYPEAVAEIVHRSVELFEGRTLVLFTSYAALQDCHARISEPLADLGIQVLRQGEADRARLLDRFKAEKGTVLLATDSFWEGVDAPGETLELVVVCRLPFRVPTNPVLMARMQAIEERGGNSFYDLALPDAAMRLRQGFGRLIRSRTDRGAVLVLDSRVVKRSYGRPLLDALPATPRVSETGHLLEQLEEFVVAMRSG